MIIPDVPDVPDVPNTGKPAGIEAAVKKIFHHFIGIGEHPPLSPCGRVRHTAPREYDKIRRNHSRGCCYHLIGDILMIVSGISWGEFDCFAANDVGVTAETVTPDIAVAINFLREYFIFSFV